MRWTLARGLLRGNLVSSQKEQVAAISTTAISEQAHQTPTRPLSSAPLPEKMRDVTDNRINLKTSVPGMLYLFIRYNLRIWNLSKINYSTSMYKYNSFNIEHVLHYVWFSQFWSHFWGTNALFASKAKINVVWNFFERRVPEGYLECRKNFKQHWF